MKSIEEKLDHIKLINSERETIQKAIGFLIKVQTEKTNRIGFHPDHTDIIVSFTNVSPALFDKIIELLLTEKRAEDQNLLNKAIELMK